MRHFGKEKGFIRIAIFIIAIIFILGYFSIDLRSVVEKPQVQDNFSYVWDKVSYAWTNFLKEPVLLFTGFLWDSVVNILDYFQGERDAPFPKPDFLPNNTN